jgi:hypothetical protein
VLTMMTLMNAVILLGGVAMKLPPLNLEIRLGNGVVRRCPRCWSFAIQALHDAS